ncbi:MAG: hypothetical protein NT011_12350 [Kiritimatiellaeota bacterium]|nr:hypothetical protein [Kiritimatiellota bacterium]
MAVWNSVLELDQHRKITSGSEQALCDAIRRGAELRIYTEFRHNEHINPNSDLSEIVQEVSDFPVTYLVDQRWVAGIMTFRMPIGPPDGFGARPSMSFFMYNQNGQQAIARPYMDGHIAMGAPGSAPIDNHGNMPKYHQQDAFDSDTNAPSSNFVYDFERYRFLVRDDWQEVLSVSSDGKPCSGSLVALVQAFEKGCEVKVAIHGLCHDLGNGPDHELFVQCGPCYYNTERKLFSTGTRPCVRVKPGVPMRYESRGWDFGWLMPRSDGFVDLWLCNPYTMQFRKFHNHYAIRWFVR